ncbi:hypothetical protein [Falsirhodobacter halotolerans]|uniref:hypothetical protein n=1 Tax=Falsirhodobacter halotolerans TaxID=1146892 RepID=UPI001FD5F7D3|nr:hypothetical protein [Falsirhodobacter halotolerans]MCJ8138567.1 hypothetical protein [Falsirhodobacter halotolerans]
MSVHDHTFHEQAAYGSDRWVAITLGKSLDWFKKHRPELERDGFPKKDGLVGLTMKADVEAWLGRRRRIADHVEARIPAGDQSKEDLGAF